MLLFEEKYKGADKATFIEKVKSVSFKLGINPNWLMYAFFLESGLDPSATNDGYTFKDGSHAVGLNQMTPIAFKEIGYTGTWLDYRKLTGTQQMDWVYKYFKEWENKITNYKQLYLINFYPSFIGRDESAEFPFDVVMANKGLDTNGDGRLTLKEFNDRLDNKARQNIPAQYLDEFMDSATGEVTEWTFVQTHKRDFVIGGFVVAFLVLISIVSYLLIKK